MVDARDKVCNRYVLAGLLATSVVMTAFPPTFAIGALLLQATTALSEACLTLDTNAVFDIGIAINALTCESKQQELADAYGRKCLVARRRVIDNRGYYLHARRDVGTCPLAAFPLYELVEPTGNLLAACDMIRYDSWAGEPRVCSTYRNSGMQKLVEPILAISNLATAVTASQCTYGEEQPRVSNV